MNEKTIMKDTNEKSASKNKKDLITTILIFVLSLVSAGIGFLILFVPEISPNTLIYVFCAILIILGIVLIAKFFAVKAYQKFHDYSFSLGVLLVVLGCIGFIRVENLSTSLDLWTGFIVLCIGIFMLQCSIQLKLLGSVVWLVDIVLTALIMIAAILTMVYWKLLMDALPVFPYWSVLVAGIVNVINFPFVLISVKKANNKPETTEDMGDITNAAYISNEADFTNETYITKEADFTNESDTISPKKKKLSLFSGFSSKDTADSSDDLPAANDYSVSDASETGSGDTFSNVSASQGENNNDIF